MTITLPQAREMAQGPLTPEQLRAISDAALLAIGFVYDNINGLLVAPSGESFCIVEDAVPHPAADLTDAVRWMVPEHLCWRYDSALGYAEVFDITTSPIKSFGSAADPTLETFDAALALTLAGWAASLKVEK